jgi:hypothetical protein
MTKPILLVASLLLALPSTLIAQTRGGAVCYQPTVQCSASYSFAPYQLPFTIGEKLEFGKTYRSEEFYAIVLKSVKAVEDPDCSFVTEAERLEAQKLWPSRKVFASHLNCPEELILYENIDRNFNFLAVYAGKTLKEAQRVLTQIKAHPSYSQVYLKRMRVILEYST